MKPNTLYTLQKQHATKCKVILARSWLLIARLYRVYS